MNSFRLGEWRQYMTCSLPILALSPRPFRQRLRTVGDSVSGEREEAPKDAQVGHLDNSPSLT